MAVVRHPSICMRASSPSMCGLPGPNSKPVRRRSRRCPRSRRARSGASCLDGAWMPKRAAADPSNCRRRGTAAAMRWSLGREGGRADQRLRTKTQRQPRPLTRLDKQKGRKPAEKGCVGELEGCERKSQSRTGPDRSPRCAARTASCERDQRRLPRPPAGNKDLESVVEVGCVKERGRRTFNDRCIMLPLNREQRH
jgi:hypothetical protein